MIHTPDELFFAINADPKGAVQAFQQVAVAADKAKKSIDDIGGGKGGKFASDRQINTSLKQDSIGDFLEGLGIGEKGLATLKTAGLTLASFNAVAASTTKILNGIAENKPASRIYQDIVEGLPIIGAVAKAFDELGTAIGRYAYGLDELEASEKRENQALKDRLQLIKDVGTAGKEARDKLAIANSPDASVASAILEYSDTSTKTTAQRNQILAMGKNQISNEARNQALQDLVDQENAAALKVFNAQMEYEKKLQDAAAETAKEKQRLNEETAKNELETQKNLERQKQILMEAKDRANQEQMRGSANLLGQIDALKESQNGKLVDISKQMRFGALAETVGVGSASQLASRERASFNPLIKLAQEAATRDERKLKALEGLCAMAQRGEATPIFIN